MSSKIKSQLRYGQWPESRVRGAPSHQPHGRDAAPGRDGARRAWPARRRGDARRLGQGAFSLDKAPTASGDAHLRDARRSDRSLSDRSGVKAREVLTKSKVTDADATARRRRLHRPWHAQRSQTVDGRSGHRVRTG